MGLSIPYPPWSKYGGFGQALSSHYMPSIPGSCADGKIRLYVPSFDVPSTSCRPITDKDPDHLADSNGLIPGTVPSHLPQPTYLVRRFILNPRTPTISPSLTISLDTIACPQPTYLVRRGVPDSATLIIWPSLILSFTEQYPRTSPSADVPSASCCSRLGHPNHLAVPSHLVHRTIPSDLPSADVPSASCCSRLGHPNHLVVPNPLVHGTRPSHFPLSRRT
jgi:hypothetical protein